MNIEIDRPQFSDTAPGDDLSERAARLYPDSEYLRQEWVRAVRTVRTTPRGWLLDGDAARGIRFSS